MQNLTIIFQCFLFFYRRRGEINNLDWLLKALVLFSSNNFMAVYNFQECNFASGKDSNTCFLCGFNFIYTWNMEHPSHPGRALHLYPGCWQLLHHRPLHPAPHCGQHLLGRFPHCAPRWQDLRHVKELQFSGSNV